MPRSLDLDRLKQFETQSMTGQGARTTPASLETARQPHAPASVVSDSARWPSREPVRDGQISIKAPIEVIERFRVLCRDDRRTYADMLTILMDAFPGPQR